MLRAMYTGVSGLRTHQFKMDVIGNNIANVNTVGFKRSTATFKEVFNQTLQGASGARGGMAGTNPQQVGLGVTQGATSVVHTQGAAQTTDNPMDVMIDGNSFFVVSNDENFLNRFYTRAGNFQLDELGTLSTPDGYKVLGYQVDENGELDGDVSELVVNKADTMEPTPTENINMIGNLNSQAEVGTTRNVDTRVYDSLGNSYTVRFEFEKTAPNTWSSTLQRITDANGDVRFGPNAVAPIITVDGGSFTQTVNFDGNTGRPIPPAPPQSLTPNLNLTMAGNISTFGAGGDIEIDFSRITQFGSAFGIEAKRMDGNTAGGVDSFSITRAGGLEVRYTNGESKTLGVLALAKFENNSGLEKTGGNLYQNTRNSGDAVLGISGEQGYGILNPGALEMSNVDLSYEFTELITTQRGFQSNSRIITTSDEILQELVNLKR